MIHRKLLYEFRKFWFDQTAPHEMIAVTHCGKLGDFIMALPVASWLYKTRQRKIHFILARKFAPFTQIRSLLMLQEMTGAVTLADFPVIDYRRGGYPYKFNPRRYTVPCGEYYNIGLRRRPNKYLPEFMADEHGLGYDRDFVLSLGDYPRTDEVVCSDAYMLPEVPLATPLDLSQSILDNARRLAGAKESHVTQAGMFHVLDLANIKPTRLYIYSYAKNIHLFKPNLDSLDVAYIQRDPR